MLAADHGGPRLIVSDLVDDEHGRRRDEVQELAILLRRHFGRNALADGREADAVSLEEVQIEKLGDLGGAAWELRETRRGESEPLMHDRHRRDPAQPLQPDHLGARIDAEDRGLAFVRRAARKGQDLGRGSSGARHPRRAAGNTGRNSRGCAAGCDRSTTVPVLRRRTSMPSAVMSARARLIALPTATP